MEKVGGGDNSRPESATEAYKSDTAANQRVSKAIEEEESFLEYIMSLPAMSNENVEAFKKKQTPVLMRSTSEFGSGLEHLENLYKLMEHLGQLRKQNSKLQKRVKYLENIAQEEREVLDDSVKVEARRKRSAKCKSGGYGIRQSLIRSSRERSRSVGVDEMVKSRQVEGIIKSKVSKWSKVKEAFRWEKVLLPEVASQDSGIGGGEYLRVPSDQSSFSVSPADSVLSGRQPLSSTSTSEDELELDNPLNSSAGRKRYGSVIDGGSQTRLGSEDQDTRRSKSLDGDVLLSQPFIVDQHLVSSKDCKSNQYQKSYRTPWSKVKDIIQTRTGSVKKKRAAENEFDEEAVPEDEHSGSEDKDSEDKLSDVIQSEQIEETSELFLSSLGEVTNKKRLAPVLTITLPSTEELRSNNVQSDVALTAPNSTKPPPSPQLEERHSKVLVKQRTLEETTQKEPYKKQVTSSSAGTSPPTPRRQSKWTKVKNAFLTSAPSPDDILQHVSSSVPSSPVKSASFTYDLESDDLSSGEFIDDNLRDNNDDVFPESMEESFSTNCGMSNENIHNEIKKNFEELQIRLSHEFNKKLTEWERLKNSGSGGGTLPGIGKVGSSGMSSGTSSIGEDDRIFRRKMEEWDKIKNPKQREAALQQLGEENLSPDFKKKLEQWEKLKSIPISPTVENSSIVQPQFKKKITEWQRWRSGSSKTDSHGHGSSSEFPEEFSKKLQEWDKMKQSVSETEGQIISENRSPSPSMSRKEYIEQKSKKLYQRSADIGHKVMKSKSHNEVKELAWLEKELHKIEREKLRLERERDKYLEREARLEKMRRAIGSTQLKQEVLIPTSTGLFRFEGISQKFTRKLYEWEKARGIGPEASTFALLDPGYQPPFESGQNSGEGVKKNGTLLIRSKSVGSVVDVANNSSSPGVITHQPSSLSLNNMEDLDGSELTCGLEQQTSHGELFGSDTEEPQAVIVDVEDVIEETASPLIEQPTIVGETPVYCYAPDEVTHLIDSSGSDNEVSGGDRVQSSYIILQENISLLDKLQKKEDIFRKIEYEMENLEEEIHNTARNKEKQLESLGRVEPKFKEQAETLEIESDDGSGEILEIKAQLQLLEQHQEDLRHEEKTLQYSFVEHSEQQAVLAQNLVDKMRQLQEVNSSMSSDNHISSSNGATNFQLQEALAKVQDLTSQLLCMAERLEAVMGERNKEMWKLKNISSNREPHNHSALSHHSFSTDSITTYSRDSGLIRLPRQSSEELSKLPALLTNKVLELKRGLSYLCAVSDVPSLSETQDVSTNKDAHPERFDEKNKNNLGNITVYSINNDSMCKSSHQKESSISFHTNSFQAKIQNERSEASVSDDQLCSSLKLNNKLEDYTKNDVECSIVGNTAVNKDSNSVAGIALNEDSYERMPSPSDESEVNDLIHNKNKPSKPKAQNTCEKYPIQNKDLRFNSVLNSEINPEINRYDVKKEAVVKKVKRTKRSLPSENLVKTELHTKTNWDELNEEENLATDDENIVSGKKLTNRSYRFKKITKASHSSENTFQDEVVDRNHAFVGDEVKASSKNLDERVSESAINILSEFNWKENDSCKGHKSFSEKMNNLTTSIPDYDNTGNSNDVSVGDSDDINNDKVMTVNVFVPTTRKIFSPVRRDSKGKTSSVISYVVKESIPSDETVEIAMSNEGESSNKSSQPEEDNSICLEALVKNNFEDSNDMREEVRFIMPPCWILRETRAQSASPALQRRNLPSTKRRDSKTDNCEVLRKKEFDNKLDSCCPIEFSDNSLTNNMGNTGKHDSKLNIKTPPLPRKERSSIRDNSSSESCELSNTLEPKSAAVIPIRKSRTEVGFPPISPIPGRRDVKLANKEAAPSIRMMIARYNKKVSESQELVGSKSPDSGSCSPVAWRSPGAERRVKGQMERYQEEIRKVVQGNGETRRGLSGEVKKSASASIIRSWDKCGLHDGFNRRPSDGLQERQPSMNYRGILKSSSAGSIKSSHPLPGKCEAFILKEDINIVPLLATMAQNEPSRNVFNTVDSSTNLVLTPSSVPVKSTIKSDKEFINYPKCSPESSRLRALRIKKAKEEFLLRGPGGGSWSCDYSPGKPDSVSPEECIPQWTKNKSRLSQISCESDCSYEGILVSGEEQCHDSDTRLLVKSASAGMINIDSAALSNILPESTSNINVPSSSSDMGAITKSNKFGLSHLASRFRKVRMRRHKEKEKDNSNKMETVSALCRQSLLIDLQRRPTDRKDSVPSSKSCPASPVLQKRESNSSWIMKRHKIFKPK